MKVNLGMLLALFVLLANGAHAQTGGRVIIVNDVGDSVDASPGDGFCRDAAGKCTLRAAIDEANAAVGRDAIVFDVPVPAVVNLTLGELRTTNPVSILGRGARNLTVQRSFAPNTSNFRIFHLAAQTYLRGLTIKNGKTTSAGGGILVAENSSLVELTVTANVANAGGGIGLQGESEHNATIERCLINSNTGLANGGGLYVGPGMGIRLKSSTLTENSAPSAGGLFHNGSYSVLTFNTIVRNSSSQGASGIYNLSNGIVEINNTIIGPDSGTAASVIEGNGFLFWGVNLITQPAGGSDPMLGPLANNGGPTDTIAPLPGSPAIDGGEDCETVGCTSPWDFRATFDQRRFPRKGGPQFDVGAYETGGSADQETETRSIFFSQTQRLAYSRVIVLNPETMERQETFISLWDTVQQRPGGTRPVTIKKNGIYVAYTSAKQTVTDNPLIIQPSGS